MKLYLICEQEQLRQFTHQMKKTCCRILFIVPTDAHYYKIVEMLKQFKNYDTCSDMFRFTQEPSSGSSHVLS
jgi:hypothetical protein